MSDLVAVVTVAAALGCGLTAGVLFAFSSFVMQALGRLRPADGVAAMQAINVAAVTPAFMTALFAPAVLCLGLGVVGVLEAGASYGPWLVVGGALYLAGAIGLTIAYHVPRNDRLAGLAPATADAARYWERYQAEWGAWNHVRAAAALAAAAALTVALHVG